MLPKSIQITPFAKTIRGLASLLGLALCFAGCSPGVPSDPASVDRNHSRPSRVIAQGQILPAEGFVRLAATPGDVIEHIDVVVGDSVQADDKLVTMKSERVRQKQLEALEHSLREAERQKAQAESQAQRRVQATQLKLEQLAAQQASLKRKAELLAFAEQQVDQSKAVLSKLESIAQDTLTSEFVGQLEIDRQSVAVSEAELKYRQQKETHLQAKEELHWAILATQAEKEAAEEMLLSAQQADPVSRIRSEIATLNEQIHASLIVAPTSGVVVAVNANVGEASVRLPVIELANLELLVCEVEVNEMDAARVQVGQSAKIRSRAFGTQVLNGRVKQKYSMVGRPQLKPLDPLARVDYRAVTVVVELEPGESTELAKPWLQLQVEVEIDTAQNSALSAKPAQSPTPDAPTQNPPNNT